MSRKREIHKKEQDFMKVNFQQSCSFYVQQLF